MRCVVRAPVDGTQDTVRCGQSRRAALGAVRKIVLYCIVLVIEVASVRKVLETSDFLTLDIEGSELSVMLRLSHDTRAVFGGRC